MPSQEKAAKSLRVPGLQFTVGAVSWWWQAKDRAFSDLLASVHGSQRPSHVIVDGADDLARFLSHLSLVLPPEGIAPSALRTEVAHFIAANPDLAAGMLGANPRMLSHAQPSDLLPILRASHADVRDAGGSPSTRSRADRVHFAV